MNGVTRMEHISVGYPIPEGALRRRLRAELSRIDEVIRHSGLNDPMTLTIGKWRRAFVQGLNLDADEASVRDLFISFLHEFLIDPVMSTPLDRLAYLGSDGNTYGSLASAVWKLKMPARYHSRSLCNPNDPTPFTVAPHPVVRHVVGWLSDHNACLYSRELELTYARLSKGRPRVSRVVVDADVKAAEEKFAKSRQRVQAVYEGINKGIDEVGRPLREMAGRIEAFQNGEESALAGLSASARRIVAMLQTEKTVTDEEMKRFNQKRAELQADIEELKIGNQALLRDLENLGREIDEEKVQTLVFQQQVKELDLAIKEMKNDWAGQIFRLATTFVFSTFGNLAIGAFLESSSIGVGIANLKGGAAFALRINL